MSCVFLFPIKGVWSSDWAASYQSHCAFVGTSVTIPCTYHIPPRHHLISVTWYRGDSTRVGWRGYPLSYIDSLKRRLEYLGDTSGLCTLRINKLRATDQEGYFIVLTTNMTRWTAPYIDLTVQGRLHVACCWYFINVMLCYVDFVK